jgi:hypothetical protein
MTEHPTGEITDLSQELEKKTDMTVSEQIWPLWKRRVQG